MRTSLLRKIIWVTFPWSTRVNIARYENKWNSIYKQRRIYSWLQLFCGNASQQTPCERDWCDAIPYNRLQLMLPFLFWKKKKILGYLDYKKIFIHNLLKYLSCLYNDTFYNPKLCCGYREAPNKNWNKQNKPIWLARV